MAFRLVRLTQRSDPYGRKGSAVMDFQDESGDTESVGIELGGTLSEIVSSLKGAVLAIEAMIEFDAPLSEPTPTPTTEEVETEAAELFAAAED